MTTKEDAVKAFVDAGSKTQESLLELAPSMQAYQLRMSRIIIQNIDKLMQNLRVDGDATKQIDEIMADRNVRPAGRVAAAKA